MLNRIHLPLVNGLTLVREWRESDLHERVALLQDQGIQDFVSSAPSSLPKAESQLVDEILATETGAAFRLAVCSADSGRIVGLCGLGFLSTHDLRVELVVGIAEAHRRQGHARRAVELLCGAAFTANLSLGSIYCRIQRSNTDSSALAAAIGLSRLVIPGISSYSSGETHFVINRSDGA